MQPLAAVAERRALLRHVLASAAVATPIADSDLDALMPQQTATLLEALRAGRPFSAPGVAVAGKPPPLPPKPATASLRPWTAPPHTLPVAVRGDESGSDEDDATSAGTPQSPAPAAAPLEMETPLPPELMDDLPVAAYTLAAAAAADGGGFGAPLAQLLPWLRRQLAVSPTTAAHVAAALSALQQPPPLGLRLSLALLRGCEGAAEGGGDPLLLLRGRELARWRAVQAALLLSPLAGAQAAPLRPALLCGAAGGCAAAEAALGTACGPAWALPLPCACGLWAALLGAQWDVLDEGDGVPTVEGLRLVAALAQHLQLQQELQLTQPSRDAHVVFAALARWTAGGSLDALRRGAAAARSLAAAAAAVGGAARCRPPAEAAHLACTLGPVVARCEALLCDAHAAFPYGADERFSTARREGGLRRRQRPVLTPGSFPTLLLLLPSFWRSPPTRPRRWPLPARLACRCLRRTRALLSASVGRWRLPMHA